MYCRSKYNIKREFGTSDEAKMLKRFWSIKNWFEIEVLKDKRRYKKIKCHFVNKFVFHTFARIKDRLPVWNWFQPTKQESIGIKLSSTHWLRVNFLWFWLAHHCIDGNGLIISQMLSSAIIRLKNELRYQKCTVRNQLWASNGDRVEKTWDRVHNENVLFLI